MEMDIEVYTYLVRPDTFGIWNHKEVRERLSWYYSVMKKIYPPRYLIAKYTPAEYTREAGLDELLEIHIRTRKDFEKLLRDVVNGERLDSLEKPGKSFLDLKIDIAYKLLENCGLCEWNCRINRLAGRRGVCGLGREAYIGSAFLHFGEEAPLVPSGTIFFTGCSLKCVFCQNWDISHHAEAGVVADAHRIAEVATELADSGAKNINYVGGNPDQSLHLILESMRYLDRWIPQLWNSNMYMTTEALELLLDVIDIWLPDLKWWDDSHAFAYSRIKRYREVVTRNIKMVHDHGADLIIRHLIMPNHVECCTLPILDWIAENTPRALVNIMDQYRPEYKAAKEERFREIGRRVTREEVRKAMRHASRLGIVYEPIS